MDVSRAGHGEVSWTVLELDAPLPSRCVDYHVCSCLFLLTTLHIAGRYHLCMCLLVLLNSSCSEF